MAWGRVWQKSLVGPRSFCLGYCSASTRIPIQCIVAFRISIVHFGLFFTRLGKFRALSYISTVMGGLLVSLPVFPCCIAAFIMTPPLLAPPSIT